MKNTFLVVIGLALFFVPLCAMELDKLIAFLEEGVASLATAKYDFDKTMDLCRALKNSECTPQIVTLLLDAKANPNGCTFFGAESPLQSAIGCQTSWQVPQLLIDAGANVAINSSVNGTILHTAGKYANVQAVKVLLKKYKMDPNVMCLQRVGVTPLFWCCQYIKAKRDFAERSHESSVYEQKRDHLMAHTQQQLNFTVFGISTNDGSPLFNEYVEPGDALRYALTDNERETLTTLIEFGADPNIMHQELQTTPMKLAIENNIPLDEIYIMWRKKKLLQQKEFQGFLDYVLVEGYQAERADGKLCFSKDAYGNTIVYVKKNPREHPGLPVEVVSHIFDKLEYRWKLQELVPALAEESVRE